MCILMHFLSCWMGSSDLKFAFLIHSSLAIKVYNQLPCPKDYILSSYFLFFLFLNSYIYTVLTVAEGLNL